MAFNTITRNSYMLLVLICTVFLTLFTMGEPAYAGKINSTMQKQENAEQFYIKEITPDIFARIKDKSYKDDCIVPLAELRYLHILHKDLHGKTLSGEIICNKYIAKDVLEIFTKLYEANYPIERVRLIDEYGADDETSMRANNSSSFNFRFISHTKKISKHGLGMAIDINPLYNPYVKKVDGKVHIEPATASEYIDRNRDFSYKIDENDLAYKLFTEHGFEWGGAWKSVKDYQHFEIPSSVIDKLYKQQN